MCISFCFEHSSHWTFRSAYETWIRIPVPQLLLNCHRDRLTLKESSQRFSYSNLQKVNFPWAILFFSIEKLDFFNYILFFFSFKFLAKTEKSQRFSLTLSNGCVEWKKQHKNVFVCWPIGPKDIFLSCAWFIVFHWNFCKGKGKQLNVESEVKCTCEFEQCKKVSKN